MMRSSAIAVLFVGAGMALPAQARPVTVEELQQALGERDKVIAMLRQRVEALEAASAAKPAALAEAAASPAAAARPEQSSATTEDDSQLQALSRGLVQQGLLLLPRGGLEVSPSVAYSHSQQQGLVLVDSPEGISIVSDQRRRFDAVEAAMTVRYGLPWRSQIQLRVPYSWRRDVAALGDGSHVSHSDTHVGDVELELAHQLIREDHGLPGVIAAVSWKFPTGRDPFDAPIPSVAGGGGSHEVSGRLTVLKSFDPIVAYTTLSYSHSFRRRESFGRVNPGDTIDWSLGALLAVSPETSINLGLSQQFRGHTSVDGTRIAGSNGVAALAQLGVDQLLGSRGLLSVTLGVGLTDDAPDYQLVISTPFRVR